MKLNKEKIYDLSELTSEERNEVDKYIKSIQPKYNTITVNKYSILEFKTYNEWCYWHKESSIEYNYETTNAKELFYTLENIQVDCKELSEEQIREMSDVYVNNGYTYTNDVDFALRVNDKDFYLQALEDKEVCVYGSDPKCTTITYEKFMELFGSKEENFKKLDESFLNEELTNALELFEEEKSIYDDMLSLIEKGKQQGLKIVVTFEKI